MSIVDSYVYRLVSCGAHPNIDKVCTSVTPSPFDGQVVYIDQFYNLQTLDPSKTYEVLFLGLNISCSSGPMPQLAATSLVSCADPNASLIFRLTNCADTKDVRFVLFVVAPNIGDVVNFVGECTCWVVQNLTSVYTEAPTVDTIYVTCADCLGTVAGAVCINQTRTIGYALKVKLPQPEPPDRGFIECCYSNLVFGDLGDTDPYKNDFSSVFFQKQTPSDTVTFDLIGISTGTTPLVDVTHGVLYDFDPSHTNPELTYFRVDWRKILDVLGEDIFTIRMNVSIAGVGPTAVDSNSFDLRAFSQQRANNTVRIDSIMDGTLEKIDVNFKDSNYETSLRVEGYFGDAQDEVTQDNIVFGDYKEKQITLSNDPSYTFQANNIPECISRELRKFIIYANQIFISDYNLNNHSYEYELRPVVLDEVSQYGYPVQSRAVNISMSFKDRFKDNRKTNY